MCGGGGGFVGDVENLVGGGPDMGGGKNATEVVGNPLGNMAFTTPDSEVGKASVVAGAPVLAAPAAGAAAAPAAAYGGAGDVATSAAATTSDVLGTVKTLAPVVGATANLLAAGAAAEQGRAAKNANNQNNVAPVAPPLPQLPTDPDVSALRKKNALLFGSDTPASTDITGSTANTGSLGRATLLGGGSKLGA